MQYSSATPWEVMQPQYSQSHTSQGKISPGLYVHHIFASLNLHTSAGIAGDFMRAAHDKSGHRSRTQRRSHVKTPVPGGGFTSNGYSLRSQWAARDKVRRELCRRRTSSRVGGAGAKPPLPNIRLRSENAGSRVPPQRLWGSASKGTANIGAALAVFTREKNTKMDVFSLRPSELQYAPESLDPAQWGWRRRWAE